MVVPVPPAPVAPLGDQQFLISTCARFLGQTAAGVVKCSPRLPQLVPRAAIVLVANPDVEIPIDPRPWKNRWHHRRCVSGGLPHRHRANRGVILEARVQRAKKRTTTAFEVLPRVLAIENDRD